MKLTCLLAMGGALKARNYQPPFSPAFLSTSQTSAQSLLKSLDKEQTIWISAYRRESYLSVPLAILLIMSEPLLGHLCTCHRLGNKG